MAGGARQHWRGEAPPLYFSCIFSRMGTIMSNLGRLAGSSFIQIFISLQMCGEMPGGMVGRSPSSATCKEEEPESALGPCPHGQGHLPPAQVVPNPLQPGLKNFQGWSSQSSLSNQCQGLNGQNFSANCDPNQFLCPSTPSPSYRSPCWTGQRRAPHVSPAPTAAPRSSTCQLSAG